MAVLFPFLLTISIGCSILVAGGPVKKEYMLKRADMIKEDRKTGTGRLLELNVNERLVSDYLLFEKQRVMKASRENKIVYFPSLSFYHSKPMIENSPIYKIIKKMPKGAALHIHDIALTSLDWVVRNLTYRNNVYMCVNSQHFMVFKFLPKLVPNPGCEWKSVKAERAKSTDVDAFDESIRSNLSFITTDPLTAFKDSPDAWRRFSMYFAQVFGILMSSLTCADYYGQALEEFYADNVQYMEVRAQMWGFANLDGSSNDAEYGLKMYRKVTSDFVKKHPDFAGAKFINSGLRMLSVPEIKSQIKVAMDLRKRYPDSFLGYDLVGQEDVNNPLLYYLDALIYPSEQKPPFKLPYFFHAAETNWQGTDVDYNLVDALLLNTTRIGHGYGLPKHPSLVKKARDARVAVEVNPISNQLLRLVGDLRNHAMVPLMANNFPIVISSDDPAVFGSAPLSHDFFMAFMNMCGEDAGLEFLKQLAINSIEYSAMTDTEKEKLMNLWKGKWDKFITETVAFIQKNHVHWKDFSSPDRFRPTAEPLDFGTSHGSHASLRFEIVALFSVTWLLYSL